MLVKQKVLGVSHEDELCADSVVMTVDGRNQAQVKAAVKDMFIISG